VNSAASPLRDNSKSQISARAVRLRFSSAEDGTERFFQANEHDVKRARLELDGLAGLDFQSSFDLSHLRDATLHLHLVKFESGGNVRRSTDEAIGRRSVVFDRHVASM
jgi:hypothetical protein